jgi:hypothetical protein
MTKGEYRVGITFNPSGDDRVSEIKRMAADLIDMIEDIPAPNAEISPEQDRQRGEVMRLKAHAQTLVEDAAMNAVKAATKRQPGE